jgi:regulator of cell morphogenesis and NO signaling
MMQTLDIDQTVGQLVREKPNRSRVFEALNIDYCCGGKVRLEDACRRKGVEVERVLRQLAESDADVGASPDALINADEMQLTELADHIESTHHAYLKNELPRLDQITEKVARVHGDRDPRLLTVRKAFVALRDELIPHMRKEETILFPLVRELERRAETSPADSSFVFQGGAIANPIRQMEPEHEHAGDALAIMRQETDGFVPPEWACNTYRAMLDRLKALEHDMHHHVHKENNVLFPKALQLEPIA